MVTTEGCTGTMDPLIKEDTQVEEEDLLDPLEDKDHQALKDLLGPMRPIIVQTPQVTLDTTALENTFDTVGQSMMHLARAQDQTNRQLQQHIQQGQPTCKPIWEPYNNWLPQLIRETLIIYLLVFLYMMEVIEKAFFPWLERLEVACFYSGRNIKTKALRRSTGPVQNVIMALPNARSWRPIREEMKRCFSDQTSLGHADAQLENMTQKPNEP